MNAFEIGVAEGMTKIASVEGYARWVGKNVTGPKAKRVHTAQSRLYAAAKGAGGKTARTRRKASRALESGRDILAMPS